MADRLERGELPACPYPGIAPFSWADREVFFSRDDEARRLIRLIVLYRGVLLYSASGAGKSSLVNARVIPLALEEGYRPERLRVQPRQGAEIIVEPQPFPSFLSRAGGERTVLSVEALLAALETLSGVAESARPLLIFDQFEEWVTLFEEAAPGPAADEARACREKILAALVALIQDTSLPVKILLVLREDYLARLEPLFGHCPTLPDHYVRLTALKAEQIERVIRGPFEKHAGAYPTEISTELAAELKTELAARADSDGTSPTEVQIVCRSLFEAGLAGRDPAAVFREQGGVQGLLERYLERSLEALEPDLRGPGISLLACMVTTAGTRNVISRDDLIERVHLEEGAAKELLGHALDRLETETHLVRRELRREVYFYEIVSEFLVGWIGRRAASRRLERVQRTNRRLWVLVGGLAAVAVVIGCLALAAVQSWRQAERRRQILNAQFLGQSASEVGGLDLELRRGLLLALEAVDRAGPGRWRRAPMSWLPWEAPDATERKAAAAAETALRLILGRVRGFVPGSRKHPVIRSALTRDGRWLAGTGPDGTLQLWEVTNTGLDADPIILSGYREKLAAVAVSPDRRWVAAAQETDKVVLWDLKSAEGRTTPLSLSARDPAVSALDFSADGRWLLAAGRKATPETWDLEALQAGSVPWACPAGATIRWALGPEALHLAVACADGTAVLWDLRSAEPGRGRLLRGHKKEISALAFDTDEDTLATGDLAGIVCLWKINGAPEPHCGDRSHGIEITALSFSPDGRWLVVGSKSSVQAWYGLERPMDSTPWNGSKAVRNLFWSDDGDWLWLLAQAGGEFPAALELDSPGDPDDPFLSTTDPKLLAARMVLANSDAAVDRLVFVGNGTWIVSHTVTGRTLISPVSESELAAPEPRILTASGQVVALAWHGSELLIARRSGTLQLWDPRSDRGLVEVLKDQLSALLPETQSSVYSPDGRWLVAADPQVGVRLLDLSGKDVTARNLPIKLQEREKVWAISDRATWLLTGLFKEGIASPRLWNLKAPREAPVKLRRHENPQVGTFSHDDRWLITGGIEAARLWDLDKVHAMVQKGLAPEPSLSWAGTSSGAAFSPDSRQFAVAGVRIFLGSLDPAHGTAVSAPAAAMTDPTVSSIAFSFDGHRLALGGFNAPTSLWDLRVPDPAASAMTLPGRSMSLTFDPAGRWLFTGDLDGTVRRFRLDKDELLDLACRTAGRNLTREEWAQYLHGEPYRKTCPDFP